MKTLAQDPCYGGRQIRDPKGECMLAQPFFIPHSAFRIQVGGRE